MSFSVEKKAEARANTLTSLCTYGVLGGISGFGVGSWATFIVEGNERHRVAKILDVV